MTQFTNIDPAEYAAEMKKAMEAFRNSPAHKAYKKREWEIMGHYASELMGVDVIGEVKPVYTIYLSGPMTGLPEFNSAEFAKYAEKYRAKGWRVLSPPELDAGDHGRSYSYYIRRDVGVLLNENVNAMYMLPGWQQSRGAKLEKHIADLFEIPVYDVTTDKLWTESVTQEAYRIVRGQRGIDYGHPFDDFGRTAGMLNAALNHKLKENLTQEDVAIIMMLVKISRLVNSPDHRDSVVDIPGYAETYWMVRERREALKNG